MDIKDLKGLVEAYQQINAPQEVDEAVKGESSERRKDLAAERRAGVKPLSLISSCTFSSSLFYSNISNCCLRYLLSPIISSFSLDKFMNSIEASL